MQTKLQRPKFPLLPPAVRRQMLEQQLKARQMVLAQQASSAVAAASKTQREVRLVLPNFIMFSCLGTRCSCVHHAA